jgi:hypothetical protein
MTNDLAERTQRGSLLRRAGVVVARVAWIAAGLWTTLALFFAAPVQPWARTAFAAALFTAFVLALRRPHGATGLRDRMLPSRGLAAAAAAAAVAHAGYYFLVAKPDPNQDWAPDHARVPAVEFDGDFVRVRDVRSFDWRPDGSFTPGFFDAVYDVRKIDSMDYVVAPFSPESTVAHVFVCFGFSDGQRVAVSVEGRRLRGQSYSPIGSLFRSHQLIYVVGDERDVVGVRGAVWEQRVQLYPARSTDERKRALFRDMMRRADSLEEHPEFYNLVTNNCMNNIIRHLRVLGGRELPSEWRVLLTGLSDRVAYNLGYLDTELSFREARAFFRVDELIRRYIDDPDFSRRIRRLPVTSP